ncbi:MAG TPA: glycosyl hydrolase family 32 [Propionibacteriaceae bacterium]|jgi:beta-fructofuranosidase|nr:glycosyl hydrolase family 32 [Propionibacteriaceae bacterium]HBY24151.1 glycosyl hydrolase family 32 [Propionibacteriaceae bacterium]
MGHNPERHDMLLLEDSWTWDFWIARDGADYHLFFLKAPKSLGDPNLRHEAARVGHAVGTNLRDWSVLPDALGPAHEGAWDDLATWTGSVLHADGRWHMFYTGINRRERAAHQRIGVATSSDLTTWTKNPEPVLTLDETRYEGRVPGWDTVDWRDPWVYRTAGTGDYRMLFTARAPGGAIDERGVIGMARSSDLVHWTTDAPMYAPAQFGHLEVPQLFEVGGLWYLSYSVYAAQHSARRRRTSRAVTGTHYAIGPTEFGPWRTPSQDFFSGDPKGELYAGRFERDPDGNLVFIAFLQYVDGGPFVGGLSDPYPVEVKSDGQLAINPGRITLPVAL